MKKIWLIAGLGAPMISFATTSQQSHDPIASVLLWVTLIFAFALLGRYLAKRFNQPGVLGELLMGVCLGNISYWAGLQIAVVLREGAAIFPIIQQTLEGFSLSTAVQHAIPNPFYAEQMIQALSSPQGIEWVKVGVILDTFSRYGVIFLLFMVGLESSITELKHTGREAVQVALIGVIAPVVLGFAAATLLIPNTNFSTSLFIAATLSATSIGITARVLAELHKLQTREAKTILGAAMLDDVLGLIILSVVCGVVTKGYVDFFLISKIILSTLVFFAGVMLLSPPILRVLVKLGRFLEPWETKLFIAFIYVMLLAWLATVAQLAAIIGAFAAGMMLNESFFPATSSTKLFSIRDLVAPLESLLAPLFFILIGIQVKLESFADKQVLIIAAGLIVAAIVGKLLSGLGASRQDKRLLVGIGMLPRGEVGLVFAAIGRTLGVISDQLFSAIILMVIVTTLLAPIGLKTYYTMFVKDDRHAS